jgi:hypothetical protein
MMQNTRNIDINITSWEFASFQVHEISNSNKFLISCICYLLYKR